MRAIVVYVFPNTGAFDNLARRFVADYQRFPPGEVEHAVVVVVNGGSIDKKCEDIFRPIGNCIFLPHDNSGFDIGGYQHAARTLGHMCDLMVFFGASTYLKGPNWLMRMAVSFLKHGPALYGVMGNQGDARVNVKPHIRTTGWWIPPSLLNKYPVVVSKPEQRHPFEHGPDCLTSWVYAQGLKVFVVTWKEEVEWPNWDAIPNGFHRGDQSALLAGDHISEPPYFAIR